MPCPHNEITIVQRSQRQSAVAAAAYQSGEKLFCEYDQQVKHYPEKRGIVHNEILLPPNAPQEYADRNTLSVVHVTGTSLSCCSKQDCVSVNFAVWLWATSTLIQALYRSSVKFCIARSAPSVNHTSKRLKAWRGIDRSR